MRFLLAAALVLAVNAQNPSQTTNASPAELLLEFAATARGENQHALLDWHNGTHPCSWSGVSCSGKSVTALRLPKAGLKGAIAPGLAQLTSLQHINLAGNELTGRLPAGWARLASLERLYLEDNQLTGPLPATWNMLDGMKYLSLSGNRLTGPLPAAWSSMGQLYLLDLSANNISGSLPPPWARQRMLFRLDLARNSLSGSLPREWGRLRSLLQLDLSGNGLTGALPSDWAALGKAASLDLSGNRLEGALPAAWGGLSSLQILLLRGNQLSGAVPPQWASLSDRAYRISLSDNQGLCGAVPPPLSSAILAAGSSSKGTGLAAPCPWQSDADALLQFKVAVADGRQGALADWLPEANPCSSGAWTGVSCRGGRVVILNLANAGLSIASLEPLGSLPALQKVLLAGNSAPNATLPASWANLEQLTVADLTGSGMAGTLPTVWSRLHSLKQLLLSGNSLSGSLPSAWVALGNLDTLNVARNSLSGSLPEAWGGMPMLSALDASGNYLSGSLPDSWRDLSSLEALQLANNNLAGAIPASWAHLPSLTLLNVASNVGVCGGEPAWRAGTQVQTDATNVHASCIMVNTSGTFAGVVLGVALSVCLASLVAVGALVVYVRRQCTQLHLLQRERSVASFTSFTFADKMAKLHSFPAAGGGGGGGGGHISAGGGGIDKAKALTIPDPWSDELGGYIQVPMATPHGSVPAEATTPRGGSAPQQDHRSPSPVSGMPSPERHQWQVAALAADRGVDLTARKARQKRLFRSRSEAPSTLLAAAFAEEQRQGEGALAASLAMAAPEWSQEDAGALDMLRVHSRLALLPTDGGMV